MPVAVAAEPVATEVVSTSSFTLSESAGLRDAHAAREAEARLGRQIRGAVAHALALYDEKGRAELIEDLCQEVWCRLLERRALPRFRGASAGSHRRYLRRIAINVVVDDLRQRGAKKRRPAKLLSLDAARFELDRHVAPADSPERRLIARERLRALLALCRKVVGDGARPEQWRVARLGLLEGRPSVEIARSLGGAWSVIAIDSYLSRLRQRLGRHGVRIPYRARGGLRR